MGTTMYLRNRGECAEAAREIRRLGLRATAHEIFRGDRYVMNISRRYAGGDPGFEAELMRCIKERVTERRVRERAE